MPAKVLSAAAVPTLSMLALSVCAPCTASLSRFLTLPRSWDPAFQPAALHRPRAALPWYRLPVPPRSWDPVFQPDGFQETYAEMDKEVRGVRQAAARGVCAAGAAPHGAAGGGGGSCRAAPRRAPCTAAQLPAAPSPLPPPAQIKNTISHRYRSLDKLRAHLLAAYGAPAS